jgi:hypothetical protein
MLKIISSKALGLVVSGLTLVASTGGAVKISQDVDSYKPTVPEVKRVTRATNSVEVKDDTLVRTDLNSASDKSLPQPTPIMKVEIKEKVETKSSAQTSSKTTAPKSDTSTTSSKTDDDRDWERNKAELETEWESAKHDNETQESHDDEHADEEKTEIEVKTSL